MSKVKLVEYYKNDFYGLRDARNTLELRGTIVASASCKNEDLVRFMTTSKMDYSRKYTHNGRVTYVYGGGSKEVHISSTEIITPKSLPK